MLTEEQVKNALKAVKYPGYSRDIVSFGLIKQVSISETAISVLIELTSGSPETARQIKAECEQVFHGLPGIKHALADVRLPAAPAAGTAPVAAGPWAGQQRVGNINRIVAVASGKGGVGKSTTSVNLACALSQMGAKVGLLDCDIYGPSIPLMMGIHRKPMISEDEKLIPPENHGVKLMSMGFLIDGDNPVIWRGPMIMKTIQQFVHTVAWGELDYLLVDLPPGTGDAQLSLCQTVPLDGGVIVTTPQEASLGVVRKGIGMFQKVNVPILGIVENMSYFMTPAGEKVPIFGEGGGRLEAARQNVPLLGQIPIFVEIREGGDTGVPVTVSSPQSPAAKGFFEVAAALKQLLSKPKTPAP